MVRRSDLRGTHWVPLLCLVLRPTSANVHNPDESGRALARLVLDPALVGTSGRYFEGLREIRSSPESYDEAKASALWDQSAELVGLRHDEVVRRAGAVAPLDPYSTDHRQSDGMSFLILRSTLLVNGASMRYRLLGKSGLRISELWLGTMTFPKSLIAIAIATD